MNTAKGRPGVRAHPRDGAYRVPSLARLLVLELEGEAGNRVEPTIGSPKLEQESHG